ncbi:MAG: hypothetical protein GX939_05070 [Clostridiaceae bacterium]|jgi:hypothetical protein|nr:hypothetical protein [Clostridiaceae bacterium]
MKKRIAIIILILVMLLALVISCSPSRDKHEPTKTHDTSFEIPQTSSQFVEDSKPTETQDSHQPDEEKFEMKGIVAVKDVSGWISVILINPETGRFKPLSTFDLPSGVYPYGYYAVTHPLYGQALSPDCQRMAIRVDQQHLGGRSTVGWLENDGTYVNVSELVTKEQGAFSDIPIHWGAKFGPDNYFYFCNSKRDGMYISDQDASVYRVPVDNLKSSAVELVVNRIKTNDYFIQPDGSIVESLSLRSIYSDASNRYWVIPNGHVEFRQWVDEKKMLCTYVYDIDSTKDGSSVPFLVTIDATSEITEFWDYISYQDDHMKRILPAVTNRITWDGIMSPDRSKIAFLSKTQAGNDHPELFISGASGENPIVIQTGLAFGTYDKTNDYRIVAWIDEDLTQ